MAKVRELKVFYAERRSHECQGCEIASEVTLELDEGENAGQVFLTYLKALQDRVGPQVVARVESLVADKRERNWK